MSAMDPAVSVGLTELQQVAARRWHDVIDTLVASVPAMAQRFVARVKLIPGYDEEHLVSAADLHTTAVTCIGTLTEGLRDGSESGALVEVAQALGVKRARQGVPPESLALAVQLNFSVIWGELLQTCGPTDAILLTNRVEQVWRTVERFGSQAQSSYHDERSRLAQERVNLRQAIVARLFASSSPSALAVTRAARELNVDENAQFYVVAADRADAQERLHSLTADPRYTRYYLYRSAGRTVAFWPAGPTAGALEKIIDTLPCVRMPVVRGLSRVIGAAKAALSLLDVLDPTGSGPMTLDDGIPLLARQALRRQEIDVAARLDDALAPCSHSERTRIKDTVLAYLESGSVQTTANLLFCHRNTVLSRLSRFSDLTGLDLTVPRQAATVVLAWSGSTHAGQPRSD